VVGSIIFAVATIRAAVFSRRAAQVLAVSSAATLILAFGLGGGGTEGVGLQVLLALVLGSFAASWVALGIMALRRGPTPAIATA
jgi:hypothetical protein